MSVAALKKPLDPRKLSFQEAEIKGEIKLSALKRLGGSVMQDCGPVSFSFDFHRDFDGHAGVRGHLQATIGLQCQRCLNCVQHDIETQFNVRTVLTDAQAEAVLKSTDIVQLNDEGLLDAVALIEDELLLSLPIVAYHDDVNCGGNMQFGDEEEAVQAAKPEPAENPFAILASLHRPNEEE